MSKQGRIGLLVATVVVIVVAFVVLSPGGDDKTDKTNTTAAATPAGGGTTPATPPAPTYQTIQVKAGQPVGGIKTITVNKGDQARIQVSSPDTTEEIHLHGYDLKRDLKAGGSVRFAFNAKDDGIYEIELEGSGTQIGKLVVEP
jgi:heme/copper-type cytochrome/quinol oxidase subunit 2